MENWRHQTITVESTNRVDEQQNSSLSFCKLVIKKEDFKKLLLCTERNVNETLIF